MLDLRKLEYLVAVAEKGSVTGAAQHLHLSQQAVSGAMRALEREVGVELFARRGGGIKMLPAGLALIEEAGVLHGLANAALLRARSAGREERATLKIGHTPAISVLEVTELIHRVRENITDLATHVNQRYPSELDDQIIGGEIDIGLCRAMKPTQGLTRTVLTTHRLRVAVAADHHLASRETIRLSTLAEEPITVWGAPGKSGYTDMLIQACRDAGFEPMIRRNPIQGTPPVTAVINSPNVAFVTDPPGPAVGGTVRVLELHPPLHVPLHAVTAKYIRSDIRDDFLHAATREAPHSAEVPERPVRTVRLTPTDSRIR